MKRFSQDILCEFFYNNRLLNSFLAMVGRHRIKEFAPVKLVLNQFLRLKCSCQIQSIFSRETLSKTRNQHPSSLQLYTYLRYPLQKKAKKSFLQSQVQLYHKT